MSRRSNSEIYLNAAGHGLPDARVRARMMAHLQREEEIGPMPAAEEAGDEIAAVREKAAALIGADPREVAFSTSSSLAWSLAAAALPFKGQRVLVARHEWVSNLEFLRRYPGCAGLEIETMATTPDGSPDLDALASAIDDGVAAICVPMVSSLTGMRYAVEAIGALPRPAHTLYIVDAAQALGQMPVDVGAIGCDLLTGTVRKWLRAPRGNALTYASRDALQRMKPTPFTDSGKMTWRPESDDIVDVDAAARLESLDFNVAMRLGLGAALDVVNAEGIAAIADRIAAHTAYVRKRIDGAGLALFSPAEAHSGITTFRLPSAVAKEASCRLAAEGITVKFPQYWNEPLLPHAPGDDAIVRVSPHIYNSGAEIDALFEALAACA